MTLYLEDLAPGMVFTSGTQVVEPDEVRAFAQNFDPQPFHLDHTAAAETLFGGLAASGWHTAAISMKLIVASVPLAGGVIGGGGEIAWPKPTRPGDVLHVTSEILEVTPSRSKPDRGMGLMKSTTRNQHGEIVQVFTCKIVLNRRKV